MTMTPLFYLMTMSIDRFGIVNGGGGGGGVGVIHVHGFGMGKWDITQRLLNVVFLVWFGNIKTTDPLRLVCDAAARSGTAHHVGLCMALGYVRPQRLPGRGERHFQVLNYACATFLQQRHVCAYLCWSALEQKHAIISSVVDPDLGSGAFFNPGFQTHIFDSLVTNFWVNSIIILGALAKKIFLCLQK
jgi:hypothetical protein